MSEEDSARRLGSALAWGVAARLLRLVLGLAGTFVVVRILGAEEYGALAVIRTLLAYAAILAGAGLSQGLLRYLPVWRQRGGPRMSHVLLLSLGVHLALWAALGLLVWLTRPWLGVWPGEALAGLLILGMLLVLPEVLGHTATNVANAYYDARGITLAVLFSSLVYLGVVIWLLREGLGVRGVLYAAAVGHAVLLLVLCFRFPGYRRAANPDPGAEKPPGLAPMFKYSLPFVAIGVLNLITWRQSEVLFLEHFHGVRSAGLFDLAYRLPQSVMEFVPGAIWPLVMAGSTEVYARDPGALQRTTAAYYKLLFLLAAPLGFGGFLVGDALVRLVGAAEFAPAGPLCQVFFLVMSWSFLATPLSMAFYVAERPRIGLYLYVLNTILNVGLDLLLIPRYGLWGAVVPVTLVILVSPFLNGWALRKIGVSLTPPWRFLGRIALASACMLLLWPLRAPLSGPGGLLLLIALGSAVFVVSVRVWRVFGEEERRLMERTSPRIWRWLAPVVAGRTGGA